MTSRGDELSVDRSSEGVLKKSFGSSFKAVSTSNLGGVRKLNSYGRVSFLAESSSYRCRNVWRVVGVWLSGSLNIESELLIRTCTFL